MRARLLLFRRIILRALARERLRTSLTVFAVSLGVAVVVAIELAGTAAAGSFRSSIETLAGGADYEITAIGGIDEKILGKLVALPYPLEYFPRIEGSAGLGEGRGSASLLGLDLLQFGGLSGEQSESNDVALEAVQDPRSVWVGSRVSESVGETVRLTMNDQSDDYVVRGLLDGAGEDDLIVMDIAAAQRALGRWGKLDRIDIHAPESLEPEEWMDAVTAVLPGDAVIDPAGTETDENRKMLAAFRWNLRVLSYISVVVGAFLIYNTIAVSVVRRRNEIGVLRAVGATRMQVMAAFLSEAAFFGVAGGFLGLTLGRLMASGAVGMLASTVESLYVSSTPGPLDVTAGTWGLAVGVGAIVSLVSAFAPAVEASRVPPVEAMARGRRDYRSRIHAGRNFVIAIGLAAAAGISSMMPPVAAKPVFGYVATLLLIAATALMIPGAVKAAATIWRKLVGAALGVEAMLASRSLAASQGRTAVLVGALATAVAMTVAVGVMVGSFRETVALWLDYQFRADFYVRPEGGGGANRHPTISPELADALGDLPGVAAVDHFRVYNISYEGMPALLASGETDVVRRYGQTRFLPGHDRDEILEDLPRGDNAIVSEPFAFKHGLRAGDSISLPLGGRVRELRVLGVYYDYTNERGYVTMDRDVLERYIPGSSPTSLAVYVAEGVDPEQVRATIDEAAAPYTVGVFANSGLRETAMRIFDRTFAITYALEAIAIMVAVMGVAGALLALVIDRRREMAVLRFLGASAGQIKRLILAEAALLGLLANAIGLGLGYLLSLILIYVINKQSFGWTIQFHWPVVALVGALSTVYAATVIAGLYPARMAVRLNPIEVVHEE